MKSEQTEMDVNIYCYNWRFKLLLTLSHGLNFKILEEYLRIMRNMTTDSLIIQNRPDILNV